MSIIAAHELDSDELETDIAIIGAGASGLAVASRLNSKLTVIESGNFRIDRERQANFAAIVTGEPLDTEFVRIRAIGGATTRWTGRCAPLDEIDFGDRPWLGAPTWPVEKAELDQWYEEAWRFLLVDRGNGRDPSSNTVRDEWLGRSEDLRQQRWHYSFVRPEVARRLREDHIDSFRGGNKDLISDADCVDLETDGAKVVAATVVDRGGRRLRIRARHFIIASGCIEANRLMLIAARAEGSALAGVGKWLGRGFQQHLRVDCGEVVRGWRWAGQYQALFNRFRDRRLGSMEIGLSLRPATVLRERLANASLTFRYAPKMPYSVLGAPALAIGRLRGREPRFAFSNVRVEADVEQSTDPASRITLARETDCHGVPRADVHWKINSLERRTAIFAARAVDRMLRNNGCDGIAGIDRLSEADLVGDRLSESLHHLGGTRMSDSPATGVVDPNCKVHGIQNLWVVGGSVFSTGGHANPTLTIIALALRLAGNLNALTSGLL